MVAAKETNMDAAVATLLSEADERKTKNNTEGFSWWERCLRFTQLATGQ